MTTKMPFQDDVAVYEYARANDLAFVWEGTPAFAKRLRMLSPEQFIVRPVTTRQGITNVCLFANSILHAEWEADQSRQQALAPKRKARYQKLMTEYRQRLRGDRQDG